LSNKILKTCGCDIYFLDHLFGCVATGVTTGTANKNKIILIFKTEESPP